MARRSRTPIPNAVLASARPIDLSNQRAANKQLAKRPDWHEIAWDFFDSTPEVSQPVAYLGNQLQKIRPYPALIDPLMPEAPPVALDPTGDANDPENDANCTPAQYVAAWSELNRLHSSSGGLSEIIRAADMSLEVVGEFYLVGLTGRTQIALGLDGKEINVERDEEWMACSPQEVKVESSKIKVVVDWSSDWVTLTPADFLIRIWVRHPRDKRLAYTPMRALLADCKALRSLTAQIIAEAQSRVPAGLLKVPNDLTFGDGTTSVGPDDGNDSEVVPGTDDFMLQLASLLEETIDDPSAPGAYSPAVVRGEPEALKAMELLSLARAHDPDMEKKIDGRIQRIARGMNLPMEKALGHNETTFANGRQIDLDEYEDYHAPRAALLMDAFTVGFYQPQCRANPALIEIADRLVLVADPSALFGQPDPVANVIVAHDKLLISDAKALELLGFGPEDAPTPEEFVRRLAVRRGYISTDMTSPMLQALAKEAGIEIPLVPVGPAARAPSGGTTDGPLSLLPGVINASSRVHSNVGRTLSAIDRDLMSRLLIASSATMVRALDKAGARLAARTKGPERQLVGAVPKYQIAATLGRDRVDAITAASGDPLDGAWDDLEADFMRWGSQAQQQAIDAASKFVSGLSAGDRAALGMRQAESLIEAWTWMEGALQGLANARLFDPDPQDLLGEVDPNLKVPPGLIREAMARAGGAQNITSNGQWVALTADGNPVGGIGTGDLVAGVLRDSGGMIEAYEWDYGPGYRARPFEPHVELDGQTFANFDDPALDNSLSWPPFTSYSPGDHDHCQCNAIPTWVFAGQEG